MTSYKVTGLIIRTLVIMVVFISDAYCESHKVVRNNWTISVDSGQEFLTIEYEGLGIVVKNVRLNLKQGNQHKQLSNWKVEAGKNRMIITTAEPATNWRFAIGKNNVFRVSCSSGDGVITAVAPADKDRIPARIADPTGKPVAWNGTAEIGSYGGPQTRNLSFLPKKNPDILYLALGQVSGRNIHCLFDRRTDTVIEFSDQIRMLRGGDDQNSMAITMPPGYAAIRIIPDYYTSKLGLPFYRPIDDSYFKSAPVVWNSWTNYYAQVTEEDIVKNTDWIVENLKDYGLEYVTLDDGCERGPEGEHYWIHNWDKKKFPRGGKWLAQYIKSKGLRPGLWLVPNAYAGALEEHPEWYLRDKDGGYILDYNTPALDYTNPEVLDWLRHLFSTLKDWGYEYYKFDGEFALTEYVPAVDREKLYDKSIPGVEAYRNRLKVIRETVGRETCIEGCPSGTPLNGIGYFNSYFNGDDIYNSWLGMYPFFASINANEFLNNIVCYLMPGEGICVSPKISMEEAKSKYYSEFIRVPASRERNIASLGTTMNEARTITTFAALSGTAYSFADQLFELPEERIKLLKKTMPTVPIVPIDLFSRGGYMHWDLWEEYTPEEYTHDFPRVMDLKINAESGVYDVVSVTNWSEEDSARTISFENNLGLDPEKSYLLFDFWHRKLEGTFAGEFETFIEPHDTRVFLIRPDLGRPQLLATDRHITGALSIRNLEWEPAGFTLSGSSETIADEPYSLFIHLPDGVSLAKIDANAKVLSHKTTGSLLEIALQGQKELVHWTVEFSSSGEGR
jgi:melibiase-like protein